VQHVRCAVSHIFNAGGENVRFVCNAADGVTLTLDSRKRFKFLQDINTFTAVLLHLFLRVEKQELFMLRSLTHA